MRKTLTPAPIQRIRWQLPSQRKGIVTKILLTIQELISGLVLGFLIVLIIFLLR